MIHKHHLFIVLPSHLLLLYSLFVVDWQPMYLLLIAIVWALISGLGVNTGFHKYFSHRSFKTNKFYQYLMLFFGSLSLQGSLLVWAAVHRTSHHPYADKKQDLHSPKFGILNSYMLWHNKINVDTVNLYKIRDLSKNKLIFLQHKHYNLFLWTVLTVCFLLSWELTLSVLIPSCVLSFHCDNFLNVVGHCKSLGYRNYETDDDSVNNIFFGLIFWGLGWHNNHHHAPQRSNFGGINWWEIDFSYEIFVRLIRE